MTDVRLIGGEMTGWTDSSPVSGPMLGRLLDLLRPLVPEDGRVLVAGPHAVSLVDALASFAEVTCLVRAESDALELSGRGATVLCGTLAKLTDTDHYDVVVALDGVDRLCSPEGPQYDWAESVRVLRRAVRPGGALLLAVENELGVHRLVERTAVTSAHGDGAWRPLGEFDSKPGNPARLAERLTADGLTVGWLAAAWPLPGAPAIAATIGILRDGPAGALSALVTSAVATAYATRPVLADPRRLAAAAVRAGLGPELAPAWLVLAVRGPSAPVSLPDVLTGAGPATELPAGRLVEELLIGACLRHDLPTLRRLLTAWAARQPTASFDNLLLDGDTFRVLDPARPAVEPAVVLRGFARTLLVGGYAQPWPAAADVPALTTILLAVAGLEPGAPAGPDPAPPAPDSLREHEEQVRRLEQRLADAATLLRHTESELVKRDTELRRARLQIDTFSGKVGYRLTRLGARAARKAVRAVRRATPS
jgi:hypothetical protein